MDETKKGLRRTEESRERRQEKQEKERFVLRRLARAKEREKWGKGAVPRLPAPSIPGGFYIQLVFPILLEVLSERSEDEKGRDGDG